MSDSLVFRLLELALMVGFGHWGYRRPEVVFTRRRNRDPRLLRAISIGYLSLVAAVIVLFCVTPYSHPPRGL